MALGGRPDEREPQAGAGLRARILAAPEPWWWRPRRARPGCPPRRLRPSGAPRRRPVSRTRRRARRRARGAARFRSGSGAPARRAGPSPRTRPGSSAAHVDAASAGRQRQPVEAHGILRQVGGVLARQARAARRRAGSSRSASSRRSARASVSAPWRARYSAFPRSAASGFRSSCEASAMKRRSPSRARSSAASIRFSVSASRATSSGVRSPRACGQAQRGVAAPLDHLGAGRERGQRAQRPAGEHEGDRHDEQRGRQGGGDDQGARLPQRRVDLGGGRGDDHGAARRGAARASASGAT